MKMVLASIVVSVALTGVASPFVPELPAGKESEMLAFYQDAARHGTPRAMYALAYFNEHGIGMATNREEALTWYWKLCEKSGANPDGIQDAAAGAIDRLGGFSIPFDPLTADGNTMLDFIAAQTNNAAAVVANRILRQKSVGRTLSFTNLVAFYVQRMADGGINLTLDPANDVTRRGSRKMNTCSSVRVLFDGTSAAKARCLDREDGIARLEGLVVTNWPWYWGFVVKGIAVEPEAKDVNVALPEFDAAAITGDELLDYLRRQRQPIRKWQFIEMQSRLVGRRLTFHNLRLSGSSGSPRRKEKDFWLGAVPAWERVGEGDIAGSASFKLSFRDENARRFARQLQGISTFLRMEEVSGTFVKVEDPDDGWAFQLADVDLAPKGGVGDIEGLGTGSVSGDELIRRIGSDFTPVARLTLATRLAGREVSFVSGVVETCRPCWSNETFTLVCRMTPWVSGSRRGQPLRVSFAVSAERAREFRRTPIAGDLVVNLKARLAKDREDLPLLRRDEAPVLELDAATFDITWRTDVVKLTGLEKRPGDRIVRRLSLCWPEVRSDQFLRIAGQLDGQCVEFARGRFLRTSAQKGGTRTIEVGLEDPLYGRCVDISLVVPKGELAMQVGGLRDGAILRRIRGVLAVEPVRSEVGMPETMCVRLKDAAFEIDVKPQ